MKTAICIMVILVVGSMSGHTQEYAGEWKPERVYLHTDRNIYTAGEYLFYTMFLQGTPGRMSKFAYLVLRDQHGSFMASIRLEIDHRTSYGSIYLSDTLKTGIYQLVCFTNCMRNENEETYFHKEVVIANRFDKALDLHFDAINAEAYTNTDDTCSDTDHPNENLEIHLDKRLFLPGEKISFTINTTNIPTNSLTRLSVSVSEIFPGYPVESSVSSYFDTAYKKVSGTLSGSDLCIFHPETNGVVLQGEVFPPQPCKILVSSADSIPNLQYTTSDSLGSFSLQLNRFYDGKELILKTTENVKLIIRTDNRFTLTSPFKSSGIFNVPGIKDYLKRSGEIVQVSKVYGSQSGLELIQEFPPAKTVPRVYYHPSYIVYPSEYMELSDFVEISRELLPACKIRKNNDLYISGFINIQDQSGKDPEPQIFLDGVPIDDVNQIISLGTSQITRIETLPVWRYYGNQPFKGILAVFSRNAEINHVQFKTPAVRYQALSSHPYTRPGAFIAGTGNKRIPDVRQVLLWKPDIHITGNEKCLVYCYASDLQGIFRINIQGITAEGIPVNASQIITVHPGIK